MTFTHVHLLLSRAFQTSNELWEKQDWYWKLYASLVNLKLLCKVEIIIKEVHRPHYDCLVTWVQFTGQIKDEETIFCTQVLQVLQLSNVRQAGMTIISYMMSWLSHPGHVGVKKTPPVLLCTYLNPSDKI